MLPELEDTWIDLVVHVGMLIFIPLFALRSMCSCATLREPPRRVSRFALIPFVIFYGAFETLQGSGPAPWSQRAEPLSEVDQATREDLAQDFADGDLVRDFGVFVSIGNIASESPAMIAAGVALRGRAGAPLPCRSRSASPRSVITAHPTAVRARRPGPLHHRRRRLVLREPSPAGAKRDRCASRERLVAPREARGRPQLLLAIGSIACLALPTVRTRPSPPSR